jgi:hypothetical protein
MSAGFAAPVDRNDDHRDEEHDPTGDHQDKRAHPTGGQRVAALVGGPVEPRPAAVAELVDLRREGSTAGLAAGRAGGDEAEGEPGDEEHRPDCGEDGPTAHARQCGGPVADRRATQSGS